MARARRKLGRNAEAKSDYSMAVELDGTDPRAFNNRGALLLRCAGLRATDEIGAAHVMFSA